MFRGGAPCSVISYVTVKTMPCERCVDNSALLTAVPFHQYVVVQQVGDGATTQSDYQTVGHTFEEASRPRCCLG